MWLNKNGIANLHSISQLKEDRNKIEYLAGWCWFIHTPKGFTYHFKKDTAVCKGMPYVDMMHHPVLTSLAIMMHRALSLQMRWW